MASTGGDAAASCGGAAASSSAAGASRAPPSAAAASSSAAARTAAAKAIYVFANEKGGMKDLDTDAIHRIILECSSDSAYTARQLRQDKKVDAAVAAKRKLEVVNRQCLAALKQLMAHKWAHPFNKPVDHVALNLPTYPEIVKRPMDLGTVESKLSNGSYKNVRDFCDDIRLIWANACTFNTEGSDVFELATQVGVRGARGGGGTRARAAALVPTRPRLPRPGS